MRAGSAQIKIFVSLRCLPLICLSLLLVCCHEPQPCRNVTTSDEVSPNGLWQAVTFRRLCPEEHSVTTHVSIIRANETLPDGNGNVFGYENEIAIRVSWLSNSRLAVYTYADPGKATKIERAGKVSIEYFRVIETALVPAFPSSESGGAGTPAGGVPAATVAKPLPCPAIPEQDAKRGRENCRCRAGRPEATPSPLGPRLIVNPEKQTPIRSAPELRTRLKPLHSATPELLQLLNSFF